MKYSPVLLHARAHQSYVLLVTLCGLKLKIARGLRFIFHPLPFQSVIWKKWKWKIIIICVIIFIALIIFIIIWNIPSIVNSRYKR